MKILLIVLTVFMANLAIGRPPVSPATSSSSTATTARPRGGLRVSVDQLPAMFNNQALAFGAKMKLQPLQVVEGTKSTFKQMLTQTLSLIGTVNPDRSVDELIIISANDGTKNTINDYLICTGLVMNVVSPDLTEAERGQLLRNLGMDDRSAEIKKTVTRHYVKYTFQKSTMTGLSLTVSSVQP